MKFFNPFAGTLHKLGADTRHMQQNNTPPQTLSAAQYKAQFVTPGKRHLLVDVRTPAEFAADHLPGAINIPLQELSQRLMELPIDRPLALYCRTGNRSGQAAQLLGEEGFADAYNIGGLADLVAQGMVVQPN